MKNRAGGITLLNARYTALPPTIRIEWGQHKDSIYLGLMYIKTPEQPLSVMGGTAKFVLRMIAFSFLWWFISLNWTTYRYSEKTR